MFHAHTHIHTHIYIANTHTHTHTHTRIHAYTCTHTHTHTNIQAFSQSVSSARLLTEGMFYETGAAINCLSNICTETIATNLLPEIYGMMNRYVRKRSHTHMHTHTHTHTRIT